GKTLTRSPSPSPVPHALILRRPPKRWQSKTRRATWFSSHQTRRRSAQGQVRSRAFPLLGGKGGAHRQSSLSRPVKRCACSTPNIRNVKVVSRVFIPGARCTCNLSPFNKLEEFLPTQKCQQKGWSV